MRTADLVAMLITAIICAACFAAYWLLACGPPAHMERLLP